MIRIPRSEYLSARDADEAFSKALRSAGMDRWKTPHAAWTPAVRAAYAAKVTADEALHVAFKRDREQGRSIGLPCMTGCGFCAVDGDVYCEGCGSAYDRLGWVGERQHGGE